MSILKTIFQRKPAAGAPPPRPQPAQAGRSHADRVAAEIETFRTQVNIHELPEIFHYWSCKYLARTLDEVFGVPDMYAIFANELRASVERTGNPVIVSVGAGDGTVEAAVAQRLVDADFKDFRIECLELSPHLIERGEAMIVERGLSEQMSFRRVDLTEWSPDARFGAAFAHHSLHHIVALEHVFDRIHESLEPEGAFVTADMIGRNGHMRWPETLALIESLWRTMPERYKYHHLFGRKLEAYENWDCSGEGFEGIRAQDILPLLVERFSFEKFAAWGSLTDIFIDRAFGHNLDDKNPDDIAFIDALAEAEPALIRSGAITPTQMLAVMRKSPVPLKATAGLTPARCVRTPD